MKVYPLTAGGVTRYPTSKSAAVEGRKRRYDVDTGEPCDQCEKFQAYTREGHQRFTINDRCSLCASMDSFDLYGVLVQKVPFSDGVISATSRDVNSDRKISEEGLKLFGTAFDALYTEAQKIGPVEYWPRPPLNDAEAFAAGVSCYLRPEPCTVCGAPGVRTLSGDCHYCQLRKNQISPRQEALSKGEKWYTPLTPCPKCGEKAKKRVDNGQCSGCTGSSPDQRETAESVMVREAPDLIISREDARAQGLKVYRTGEPCRRGHTGFRYVSSTMCIDCKNGL